MRERGGKEEISEENKKEKNLRVRKKARLNGRRKVLQDQKLNKTAQDQEEVES
jgi:hypothetical protein